MPQPMRVAMRALRRFAGAAALAGAGLAGAAAPEPALPAQAASVAGFLPAGWHIERQLQVDLDGDGRSDAVLLLQPVQRPGAAAAGPSPPRLLLVLMRGADGWTLAARNPRLVPQVDLASQEDPLDNGELVAQPGGFRLSLGLAATMGSYLQATLRYGFRLDGGCVRLVRYERLELHRATLDTRDLLIDYAAGTVQHRSGNAQQDGGAQRREPLGTRPRLCLQDLDDAALFKPL